LDSAEKIEKEYDEVRVEKLKDFINKTFVAPIEKIIAVEKCFYTNTQDENFIIDTLPDDTRIVVGSICSGHGFKFAPLTGLILAQLALHGKTTVAEFEKNRAMFSIKKYLKD
jgi:sarcosine oxidase